MRQEIQFCRSHDGVRIAFAEYGDATKPALVLESVWMSQEHMWSYPTGREFLEALASMRRLITMDKRGSGASQRDVESLAVEDEVRDILAVADKLSLDRFDLMSMFGIAAIPLAAAHPERVSRLILFAALPRLNAYPANVHAMIRESWSQYTRFAGAVICPSGPGEDQRWCTAALRESTSPEYLLRFTSRRRPEQANDCARVTAPTLVLHRRDTADIKLHLGREVAALIPDAKLVVLDGDQQHPMFAVRDYMDTLRAFLDAKPPGPEPVSTEHATAVVLFADIADSTALTERMGDAAFREKARELDDALRGCVREHGGAVIDAKTLGDGILATFSSASQGIAAALACGAAGEGQGLPLHLGLHAGDVIREGDANGGWNVFGGAVNIAARISALSAPGDVLVSDVVRALARTSAGVMFEDRGEHALKGVADAQRVYAVRRSE